MNEHQESKEASFCCEQGQTFPLPDGEEDIVLSFYLFLHHPELLVDRLEVEPEESRPVEQVLEVPEGDVADPLVDRGHERGGGAVGEVKDLGGGAALLMLAMMGRNAPERGCENPVDLRICLLYSKWILYCIYLHG